MTIIKWHRRPLTDRMIDQDFDTGFERKCGCVPATNIMETEDSFEIHLAVPGMKKEDFTMEMEENILTVAVEKKEEEKQEGEYLRREFDIDEFTRSFSIPKTADVENIKAKYDNGILHITVPKIDKARLSKQIKVS